MTGRLLLALAALLVSAANASAEVLTTGLPSWFAKDGANAALGAAAIAATGWFLKEIYAAWRAFVDDQRRKREYTLRLFVEVKLTVDNAQTFQDPTYLRQYSETVRTLDSRKRPFRAYTVQVTDEKAYENFEGVAHRFPPDVIEAFRRFVLVEKISNLQYDRLSSDAFAALETERKIRSIEDFFIQMRDVDAAGRRLLYKLAYHSGEKRLIEILDGSFGSRRRSDQRADGTGHD